MSRIIGIENTSFNGSDGTQIVGKTFYASEPIDPKRGQGERADRFFMSRAKLAALDFDPAPGQTVQVLYNRFGKVAVMKLVTDDTDVIDIG